MWKKYFPNSNIYGIEIYKKLVDDNKDRLNGIEIFIGDQSSEIKVNQVKIHENTIYAATENGIYTANIIDKNLIDFNNWTHYFNENFSSVEVFNNQIYVANDRKLYNIKKHPYLKEILDHLRSVDFV